MIEYIILFGAIGLFILYKMSNKNAEREISSKKVSVQTLNAEIDDFNIEKKKDSYGNSLTAHFDSKIDKGYKIWFSMRDIVLGYNIQNAKDFLNKKDFTLVLYPEPENEHDENAVAIYSNSGKLGYIPADIAPMINDEEVLKEIVLRLRYMWVGEKRGKMELQILKKK